MVPNPVVFRRFQPPKLARHSTSNHSFLRSVRSQSLVGFLWLRRSVTRCITAEKGKFVRARWRSPASHSCPSGPNLSRSPRFEVLGLRALSWLGLQHVFRWRTSMTEGKHAYNVFEFWRTAHRTTSLSVWDIFLAPEGFLCFTRVR